MNLGSLGHNLKRASVVYSEFGLGALVSRLLRRIGLRRDRQLAVWLEDKSRTDAEFDSLFGTDTGGIQDLANEEGVVGENARYGLAHIATHPQQFTELMSGLSLPTSEYTFVDLGCGKGRALLLAAQHPFKSIIGVEFVPSFVDAARLNIKAAAAKGLRKDVEVVLSDATKFTFPPGPLLVYLFNPFDSHIIRQVAHNAYASWQSDRRPFVVVYSNPIHKDDFVACGWRVSAQGMGWMAFHCDSQSI